MGSNNDLVEFMHQMQMSVYNITREIKNSNEVLGREIRESQAELKEEIKTLNKKGGSG